MTSQSETEIFADLVDEAEKTLDYLERLSSEIQNYGAASNDLNAAAAGLETLCHSMSDVSAELKLAGTTLREIGTEKILNSQGLVIDRVDQLSNTIADINERLHKLSNMVAFTLATAAISVIVGVIAIILPFLKI